MWKSALSAAAIVCLAGPAIAAEGSRLSVPTNLQQASTEAAVPHKPATLRPARIAIAESDMSTGIPAKSKSLKPSPAPQKPMQVRTASPKPVVVGRQAEKAEKKEQSSSRRTASLSATTEAETNPDKRIKFHPVEVKPLREDARRDASYAQAAPVGEVQYPVLPADSLAGESTAEYEEDDTVIVTTEPGENFAPIISAADLPRPGRVSAAAGSEARMPPDLTEPPVQPKPAAPEVRQEKKQPRTLSSVLRLPEFRARPSRKSDE